LGTQRKWSRAIQVDTKPQRLPKNMKNLPELSNGFLRGKLFHFRRKKINQFIGKKIMFKFGEPSFDYTGLNHFTDEKSSF
jgi:hypothetical protein